MICDPAEGGALAAGYGVCSTGRRPDIRLCASLRARRQLGDGEEEVLSCNVLEISC